MTTKKILGNRGEALAKKYLMRGGYRIIAANYRSGRLEIDLIARERQQIVFIEVKTRIKTAESRQDEPLSQRQLNNLRRAITAYCGAERINPEMTRLDLIVVLVEQSQVAASIRHYRDIL